jgi:uncharacterized membrane protein (GlpM family)
MLELIVNFIIGGLIVSATTYFGSKGNGFDAAFISLFPSLTVLVFFLIYRSGGEAPVAGYAKNMLYMIPAWLLYVLSVAFLCNRLGLWWSVLIGVTLYMGASYVLLQMK